MSINRPEKLQTIEEIEASAQLQNETWSDIDRQEMMKKKKEEEREEKERELKTEREDYFAKLDADLATFEQQSEEVQKAIEMLPDIQETLSDVQSLSKQLRSEKKDRKKLDSLTGEKTVTEAKLVSVIGEAKRHITAFSKNLEETIAAAALRHFQENASLATIPNEKSARAYAQNHNIPYLLDEILHLAQEGKKGGGKMLKTIVREINIVKENAGDFLGKHKKEEIKAQKEKRMNEDNQQIAAITAEIGEIKQDVQKKRGEVGDQQRSTRIQIKAQIEQLMNERERYKKGKERADKKLRKGKEGEFLDQSNGLAIAIAQIEDDLAHVQLAFDTIDRDEKNREIMKNATFHAKKVEEEIATLHKKKQVKEKSKEIDDILQNLDAITITTEEGRKDLQKAKVRVQSVQRELQERKNTISVIKALIKKVEEEQSPLRNKIQAALDEATPERQNTPDADSNEQLETDITAANSLEELQTLQEQIDDVDDHDVALILQETHDERVRQLAEASAVAEGKSPPSDADLADTSINDEEGNKITEERINEINTSEEIRRIRGILESITDTLEAVRSAVEAAKRKEDINALDKAALTEESRLGYAWNQMVAYNEHVAGIRRMDPNALMNEYLQEYKLEEMADGIQARGEELAEALDRREQEIQNGGGGGYEVGEAEKKSLQDIINATNADRDSITAEHIDTLRKLGEMVFDRDITDDTTIGTIEKAQNNMASFIRFHTASIKNSLERGETHLLDLNLQFLECLPNAAFQLQTLGIDESDTESLREKIEQMKADIKERLPAENGSPMPPVETPVVAPPPTTPAPGATEVSPVTVDTTDNKAGNGGGATSAAAAAASLLDGL